MNFMLPPISATQHESNRTELAWAFVVWRPGERPMAKRRVLIVEDEVLIAFELGAIVQKALDAEVLMSRSVARAKQLIDQPVDLALLDVDVTNGKTFEVAMLLRLRQIPFCSFPVPDANTFQNNSATLPSYRSHRLSKN
jgi:response regulator RpfG family c-di-GMP phosphodiesterase